MKFLFLPVFFPQSCSFQKQEMDYKVVYTFIMIRGCEEKSYIFEKLFLKSYPKASAKIVLKIYIKVKS